MCFGQKRWTGVNFKTMQSETTPQLVISHVATYLLSFYMFVSFCSWLWSGTYLFSTWNLTLKPTLCIGIISINIINIIFSLMCVLLSLSLLCPRTFLHLLSSSHCLFSLPLHFSPRHCSFLLASSYSCWLIGVPASHLHAFELLPSILSIHSYQPPHLSNTTIKQNVCDSLISIHYMNQDCHGISSHYRKNKMK